MSVPEYLAPGVYGEEISSGVRPIVGVPTSVTAFVGTARRGKYHLPTKVRSFAEFERLFGGLWLRSYLGFAMRDFFQNGGTEALIVRVGRGGQLKASDLIGATHRKKRTGLYALLKAETFSLLCIPPYNAAQNVDDTVAQAAAEICADQRAFLILDGDSRWTSANDAHAAMQSVSLRSANAALYFPRLRYGNPLRGDAIESFPACGAIAGVFARTDSQHGVWKAPAGIEATLTGVNDLSVAITDRDQDLLNPLGLNCLRKQPQHGHVIWGARTTMGADSLASEWKYIPIRRLALFLEASIQRGTQWAVFEPNDEPLWANMRLNVGAFLNQLFRQGAFQGNTPSKAYFVKCDRSTMTADDLANGRLVFQIGFAPLKPAEFIILKFMIQTSA